MVSVCVLNWNRLSEIKKTIDVVLKSDIETEIIIYDQGSTDGSVEYLKSLDIENLTVILGSRNVGNSISRNVMVRISKYDFILFLDGDIVPIQKSIENLYDFIKSNEDFAFIGYDFTNCSSDLFKVTREESTIHRSDMSLNVRIALTQYGMFRKSCLVECPFPEFEPFNQSGWGAEDDIVGMTIIDAGIGKSGMIHGRHYYHNHPKSSWGNIGTDVHRLYALRYIAYRFFEYFLTPEEKIKALQTSKLPVKLLNLTQYYYKDGENLGDIALNRIFEYCFPFIKFKEDSDNLLMFGGSVFEHLHKAEAELRRNFLNVEYFGVGCHSSTQNIFLPQNYSIYPRGYETERLLNQRNIHTSGVVGDVLQLTCLLPIEDTDTPFDDLFIHDVYSNTLQYDISSDVIKVSKNGAYNLSNIPYYSYDDFFKKIIKYKKIHTSQVHPFLISSLMGKSSKLVPKDVRSLDFLYFDNLFYDMTEESSMNFRVNAQKQIPNFVDKLFNVLKNYIYTDNRNV